MANNQLTVKSMLSTPAVQARFKEVLGKRASAFMSSVISAVAINPSLSKCEPGTVIGAAAVAATLNLQINPSLGQAHIVPYSNRAQFQMGWRGYVQLGLRTGQYESIHVTEVYDGELKEHNHLTGETDFDLKGRKSDKVTGYYAFFKLLNGFKKGLFMTKEEAEVHGKKYSKSYASANGRWKQDFDAMGRKTVLKMLLSKFGVLSVQMQEGLTKDQAVVHQDGTFEYVDGANGQAQPEQVEVGNLTAAQRLQRLEARMQTIGLSPGDIDTLNAAIFAEMEVKAIPGDDTGLNMYCDKLEAELDKTAEAK